MYTIRATYLPQDEMHFDRAYYVHHHIPLAQRLLAGRVHFLSVYAEFDTQVLGADGEGRSPCVFVVQLATQSDVDAFKAFR